MRPRRRPARWVRPLTIALALAGSTAPLSPALADEPISTAGQALRGRLRRAGDRTPLAGVAVLVYPAPTGARVGEVLDPPPLDHEPVWLRRGETADDGTFVIDAVPDGRLAVEVLTPGYRRTRWILDRSAARPRELRLFLRPEDGSIYRTTVQERRVKPRIAEPAPVERHLSREEIRTMPGSQGDPLRALQSLPGVARAPFGLGLLVLRGASPRQSQVYVGDHPVPVAFHLSGLATILPAEAIESLDFAPGNFAPAFGNASGGLVAIRPRAGRRDGYHGHVLVDIGGAGAHAEGPIGKGSFLVAARRAYLDLPLRVVAAVNKHAAITYPTYYDLQAFYDRPLGRGHELHVGYLGSGDRLAFKTIEQDDGKRLSYLETRLSFHRIDAAIRGRTGATSYLLTPALRFDTNRLYSDTTNFPSGPRRGVLTTLRAQIDHRLTASVTLVVGADAEIGRQRGEVQDESAYAEASGGSATSNTTTLDHAYLGLYGEAILRRRGLMLAVGTRAAAFDVEGEQAFALDPRLRGRLELGERWTLSAGVGLYSQPWIGQVVHGSQLSDDASAATPGTLVLPDQIARNFDPTLYYGERGLRVIRALHASAGAALHLPHEIDLEAHGFVRDLRDPSYRPLSVVDGALEYWGEAAGGLAYGGEFLLRKRLTRRVYGWVAYTLLWARREAGDEPRPRRLLVDTYDQRHNLVAVLSARLPRDWQIGARFRLSSGLPYTPVIGAIGIGNDINPVFGAPLSGRFPFFHQLDVRIDKRWIRDRTIVTAYLDILNTYNYANTEAFVYSADYQRRIGGLGLPILPLFGVRVDL